MGGSPYNQTFLVSAALAFSVKNYLGVVPGGRERLGLFRGPGGPGRVPPGPGRRGPARAEHADLRAGRSRHHAFLPRLPREQVQHALALDPSAESGRRRGSGARAAASPTCWAARPTA